MFRTLVPLPFSVDTAAQLYEEQGIQEDKILNAIRNVCVIKNHHSPLRGMEDLGNTFKIM